MTIEEKAFICMRFDPARMTAYGFSNEDGTYSFSTAFLDGDFRAELTVGKDGRAAGRVVDVMNDEEYTPLRNPLYNGAYVNTVRDAYEKLLADIADACCSRVTFAADQSNRITAAILENYGVSPDFPWDDDRYSTSGVFRHADSGKWFGLIMNIRRDLLEKGAGDVQTDVINLKADESKTEALHSSPGIYPAYHMNHRKWISVLLDDTLEDGQVMELIDESYRLTAGKAAVMNDELVMEVLSIADSIPYGHVATYGQIAAMIGREKNSRLVGRIMSMADRYGDHPCHRVVNHAGRTVPGWVEQRALLEAEGIEFKENGCVDMNRFKWQKT